MRAMMVFCPGWFPLRVCLRLCVMLVQLVLVFVHRGWWRIPLGLPSRAVECARYRGVCLVSPGVRGILWGIPLLTRQAGVSLWVQTLLMVCAIIVDG